MAPKEANLANELDPSLNFIVLFYCLWYHGLHTQGISAYTYQCFVSKWRHVLVHLILTLHLPCAPPAGLLWDFSLQNFSNSGDCEEVYIYDIFIQPKGLAQLC